jgi:hypothetical protein
MDVTRRPIRHYDDEEPSSSPASDARAEAHHFPRYWAFSTTQYYPSGGTADRIGKFDTIEEAREALIANGYADDRYIVDVVTDEETQVEWDAKPIAAAREKEGK